jgi:hypothetical protein
MKRTTRRTSEWKRNSPKISDVAEKARRTFVGSSPEHRLYMKNFSERWRELRAAARDKGCTSETRASRATPAYI